MTDKDVRRDHPGTLYTRFASAEMRGKLAGGLFEAIETIFQHGRGQRKADEFLMWSETLSLRNCEESRDQDGPLIKSAAIASASVAISA